MDQRDQELLDKKKCEGFHRHENDGAIAVMLAAMFLVGMALGSVRCCDLRATPQKN